MRFTTKPLLEHLVAGDLGGQNLDRDDPIDDGVVGTPHLAHAASSEQLDQPVVSERTTLQRCLPPAAFHRTIIVVRETIAATPFARLPPRGPAIGISQVAQPAAGALTSAYLTPMTSPGNTDTASRKPVMLTVDDDPAVSRAVGRDLRRRYGDAHRIVRAESGPHALETLKQYKLRGETVAMLVADYRMPQMTGIEFLEAAMDLYPAARRVLLTAYADTHAAIDAINVVDLDHYLLKPWDPPEEKLYPVIDALLDAWRRAPEHPIPHTKVVGHRWSARSWQVRDFLARNGLYYTWFMADEPAGQQLLQAAGEDGLRLPVVVTERGTTLVEPSDAELADTLGLMTTPTQEFYDLVVIGGGPAGLAAAVYGASEGLRTVLIERTATGGQAGQSSRIENYLGFPDGVSGAQLTDRARRQATKFGAELLTTREVTGLEVHGPARIVRFSDGTAIHAHAVILATGVAYRQLAAPGCNDLTGLGVFYGSALTEATGCAGQDVYIVGGANSAGQAAVYLSRGAKSVTILVRGPSLRKSMS